MFLHIRPGFLLPSSSRPFPHQLLAEALHCSVLLPAPAGHSIPSRGCRNQHRGVQQGLSREQAKGEQAELFDLYMDEPKQNLGYVSTRSEGHKSLAYMWCRGNL